MTLSMKSIVVIVVVVVVVVVMTVMILVTVSVIAQSTRVIIKKTKRKRINCLKIGA